MNTTFSIRVDNELKQSFLSITKSKGLDGAVLLRYFMEKVSNNPDIIKFNIDEDIFDDILNKNNTVSKLEKISDKLDNLGF